MVILIFFFGVWYASLFFQTFFHHRYASHAAFKMSQGWEKVFYVGSFIFQGSSYLSPRAYAVMHRMHHAYTDTDKDPHSPSYSKNLMDMMWKTYVIYAGISNRTTEVDAKFTKNVPDWAKFDKFAGSIWPRLFWVACYVTFFAFFATSWWQWLLLPILIVMAPVHGAIINWYAHKFGYENHDMPNTSKNLLPIDILMLGESYHNNHHKFPSAINFGRKWHEIDPIYPFILLFGKLHIIQLPAKGAVVENREW